MEGLVFVGDILGWVNVPLIVAMVALTPYSRRLVPGTRQRYVVRSILRPILLLQMVIIPLMTIGFFAGQQWVQFAVYVAISPITVSNWKQFTRDDDDDWWTGLGGRIKKLLTRPLHVLAPATR